MQLLIGPYGAYYDFLVKDLKVDSILTQVRLIGLFSSSDTRHSQ